MSFLKNLFGRRRSLPEWAAFFDEARFQAFLEALRADLARRGVPFHLDPAAGILQVAVGRDEPAEIGLVTLAQRCNLAPREKWSSIIAEQFDFSVSERVATEQLIADLSQDFLRARPYLKTRLCPTAYADEDALIWQVAEGLVAVLFYDFERAVVMIRGSQPRNWGRPLDELFRIGIENVRANAQWPVEILDADAEVPVFYVQGPSFYVAAGALFLEQFVPSPPELGVLVGVPTRHVLMFHPIQTSSALGAIREMVPLLHQNFQRGPAAITPELYWWCNGSFTPLPSLVVDNGVEVSFPEEFVSRVLLEFAGSGAVKVVLP